MKFLSFLTRLRRSVYFRPVLAGLMVAIGGSALSALCSSVAHAAGYQMTVVAGGLQLAVIGAFTATIDGLLKDYIEDYIQEGVNNANPLKDIIEEKATDKAYGGRQFVYDAHVTRNISPMHTAEYGLFAEAGVQGHVQVKGDVRKLMGRVLLSPEAMADSARSEMAWEDARTNEFDNLIKDLARREEIDLSLDGRGVLCRINAGGPAQALITDSPGGVSGATFGTRYVRQGINIAAINPATGGIRAGINQVSSLTTDGTTINLATAPDGSWADNDYLVMAATSTVTSPLDTEYEEAFWGLLALVDDGTYRSNYFQIDRTVYDYANAYVNASTGALSLDLLQLLADVTDQRMNGITSLMLAHHSVRRLYIKLTQADRRYTGQDLTKPDGGTVAFKQGDITMGEVPIKAIRDFPYGTLMGLDVEQAGFCCYVSEKGKWVDEDGRILVRSGSGATARDAFEAWYRIRKQYHMKLPSVCWRADGITGATVVVVRPVGG
jgi:hypothetical protein